MLEQVIVRLTRDANPTGFSDSLKPGRNIHAVAKNVFVFDYDVADINPDTDSRRLSRGTETLRSIVRARVSVSIVSGGNTECFVGVGDTSEGSSGPRHSPAPTKVSPRMNASTRADLLAPADTSAPKILKPPLMSASRSSTDPSTNAPIWMVCGILFKIPQIAVVVED